jgi:hypothetical protein
LLNIRNTTCKVAWRIWDGERAKLNGKNKKSDFKQGLKNWMALEWYSKWKPDKPSRSCPYRV